MSQFASDVACRDDPAGRMYRFFAVLPYALLIISLPIAIATQDMIDSTDVGVTGVLLLTAATAGWIWWWTTAHPHWRSDSRKMAIYYSGRTVLLFALTWVNPFFAFAAWVGFADAAEFFSMRRAWIGMLATAAILGGSQSGGIPPDNAIQWLICGALTVFNFAIAWGFSWYEIRREAVDTRRVNTISELEQTNARLEAALEENAGLQAQLVIQAREAGVNDERQRLAREIHDTIAQGLAGIVTQLQAATDSPSAQEAGRHVDRAAQLARDSLADARHSVRNLRPPELDETALPDALKRLTDNWSRWSNIATEVSVTGTVEPLHDEIEATLLRIAQEALTNVAKHARANRVGVTLSYMGDDVSLDIRDDGVGFVPDSVQPAGDGHRFGIAGMRQRVERLAGTLDIESENGTGTAISARVPSIVSEEATVVHGE